MGLSRSFSLFLALYFHEAMVDKWGQQLYYYFGDKEVYYSNDWRGN